jgi:hypothetical protein
MGMMQIDFENGVHMFRRAQQRAGFDEVALRSHVRAVRKTFISTLP